MCDLELSPSQNGRVFDTGQGYLRLQSPFSVRRFYNKMLSFFSNNDFLMSDLINGDLLSDLEVYYETAGDTILFLVGIFFFCKKIKERGRQGRLGRLSLGDIFKNLSSTGRRGSILVWLKIPDVAFYHRKAVNACKSFFTQCVF